MAVLYVAASAVAAAAAPATSGPDLRYAAPLGCPSSDAFQSAVRARLESDTEAWPTTTFDVTVAQRGRGSVAELTFDAADGTPVRRSVEGETCEHAVDAIALITALAIDAWVEQKRREEVERQTDPKPDEPPPPPPKPVKHSPQPLPEDAAQDPLEPPSIEVGAGFRVSSPHGPEVSLGGQAFFGARFSAPWPFAARIGFAYESTGNVVVRDRATRIGEARFDWMAGLLEACPFYFRFSDAALLDLCAQVQTGAIFVSTVPGSGLQAMDSAPAFWGAAEAFGRLQFAPVGPLRVELGGGAVVPFHSGAEGRSFVVACGSACSSQELEVFRVPVIGWSAGASVALSFR